MLVGLAASDPCVTPVPESVMLRVGFVAVLVTVMLPFTLPAAVGEKEAEKVAL
jgi:hypothetical protein